MSSGASGTALEAGARLCYSSTSMYEGARTFTVGALAVADLGANAVGAVRLTCTRDGLEVELVRAAGYALGFAPAAIAEEVGFKVPYVAVRGLVRKGKALGLALDPAVATPYNRFALVRFSDDPREALLAAYASRSRARLASRVLPVPVGLLAAAWAPAALVSGPIGTASLAALVSLGVWLLLRELVAWMTWGGPVSDRYRDALEKELSRRLGLEPARMSIDVPVPEPVPEPIPDRGPDPRLRAAVAISLVSLGAIATIAALGQLTGDPKAPPPPADRLEARLAPAFVRAGGEQAESVASAAPRCLCARADSPLWKDGLPTLSFLPSPRRGATEIAPVTDAAGTPRYDFDLAVVNNSAAPVVDVRAVVTFARRDAEGERVGIKERGLFWEGELAAARAVKWRVRAPGSEMRIDADPRGKLDPAGSDAAPGDKLFELSRTARYRVVREHAAVMLAFVGDPRAAEVADSLGGGAGDERLLGRIRRATRPLFVCDVGATSACVFNGTSRPRSGLVLREIGDEGPTARSWPVAATVPVHDGVRVSLGSGSAAPVEIAVEDPSEPGR